MKRTELIKATLADYEVVQNMARFYAYDMSRDCGQQLEGWEFPKNGLYECNDFKKYLEGNSNHAFLIKIDDELAGFLFVNKLEVMPEVDWNIGEFFIVAKFQRSGIGRTIAKRIFDQFPGEWSVGAIPQNTRALNFWRKIIVEYTHGKFHEVEKTSEQLKTAEHPDPYPMILLRFRTPQPTSGNRHATHKLILREPTLQDETAFLAMTQQSQDFHHPWVKAPLTHSEFIEYIQRCQQPNQKSFLVYSPENVIVGVFNISEIVFGCFQSAYLGFYVSKDYAGKGLMSDGLNLLLNKAFIDLSLHRLEANIQPTNSSSIWLVQRNGFRKEGFSPRYLKIDNEWRDHERWALTIEDWNEK
ncbi:MAG: GNAT family N-acetyltransferase [Proteobacteria bacterium]|nr:GNAT family N-acetyltransferase [Pseudomonadota bacterium]